MSHQYGPIVKFPFEQFTRREMVRYSPLGQALPPIRRQMHRGKTRSCNPFSNVYEEKPGTPFFKASSSQCSPVKAESFSISECQQPPRDRSPRERLSFEVPTRAGDYLGELREFKVKLRKNVLFSHSATYRNRRKINFDEPVKAKSIHFPWEVFSAVKPTQSSRYKT